MASRSMRRPTEDIALARAMKDKGCIGNPELLQKVVMDEVGVKYLVYCFHSKVNVSISYLWNQWQEYKRGVGFIDFLIFRGIVYKYQRM